MDASIARFHSGTSVPEPATQRPPLTSVSSRVEMEKFYISIGTVNLPTRKPVILVHLPVDKDVMRTVT